MRTVTAPYRHCCAPPAPSAHRESRFLRTGGSPPSRLSVCCAVSCFPLRRHGSELFGAGCLLGGCSQHEKSIRSGSALSREAPPPPHFTRVPNSLGFPAPGSSVTAARRSSHPGERRRTVSARMSPGGTKSDPGFKRRLCRCPNTSAASASGKNGFHKSACSSSQTL